MFLTSIILEQTSFRVIWDEMMNIAVMYSLHFAESMLNLYAIGLLFFVKKAHTHCPLFTELSHLIKLSRIFLFLVTRLH